MKKLLLVLAIGAFVASCNDGGSTEEPTPTDSTLNAPAPDSTMITPDTTGIGDSTVVAPDTTAH